MSYLISLNSLHLEHRAHVEEFEESCRILKKFLHVCVVNVINAKVLSGSVLNPFPFISHHNHHLKLSPEKQGSC